jgi:hypothetical protein
MSHDGNCFISYAYFPHASFRADSYILSGNQSSGLQLHHLFQATIILSARSASSESPTNLNMKEPLSVGARRPSYVSPNSDGSLKVGS